jgi:hypothetical protein
LADYGQLIEAIWPEVSHLGGDVAEFGVYNGGNCFSMSRITERRVWAFDTFEGLPEEDFECGVDVDLPGNFKPDIFNVSKIHPIHGIIPIKGRFADTLKWFPGPFPMFALALVDVDLLASNNQCFEFLKTHLTTGGIIVVDDWGTHRGVQMAVDQYLRETPLARFTPPHVIRHQVKQATTSRFVNMTKVPE